MAPEKWWLEDYFPIGKYWEGNFSGAMLVSGRVSRQESVNPWRKIAISIQALISWGFVSFAATTKLAVDEASGNSMKHQLPKFFQK